MEHSQPAASAGSIHRNGQRLILAELNQQELIEQIHDILFDTANEQYAMIRQVHAIQAELLKRKITEKVLRRRNAMFVALAKDRLLPNLFDALMQEVIESVG